MFLMTVTSVFSAYATDTEMSELDESTPPSTAQSPIETSGDEETISEQFIEYATEMQTEDISEQIIISDDTVSLQGQQTTSSITSIQITTTGYIPDGVYALRNVANQSFWMDVQNDSSDPYSFIQQTSYASNPADTFTRPALFKISRVPDTDRYVIRLMTNNMLGIYSTVDREAMAADIPPSDIDVPDEKTFYITYDTTGYLITPCTSSSYKLASQSTTSSGENGYPYAKLIFSTLSNAGERAKWQLYQYTGEEKSGVSIPISPTNWNYGARVGVTYSVKLKPWSTHIGANTPYITVHPDYTDMATYSWDSTNYTLAVTPLKEGPIGIRSIIMNDETTTAYKTYLSVYTVVPEIDNKTAFIQNLGTGKYADLESASTVEGGIIQQWSFHAGEQAQWIFEAEHGGFFYIKFAHSNMYVGIDPSNTALVKQYATKSDYTLWRLTKTPSGNFSVACKATESSGKVLSTPSSTSANGADFTVLTYVDDMDYRDEWKIINFPLDASLIAIPETYNRSDYFENIINGLEIIGYENCYNNHLTVSNGVTESELLYHMQNSKVALIRTHGGRTGIEVTNGMLNTADLSNIASDYFNYSDIIIYGACGTASGGVTDSGNLVNATVAAGARTAIGFEYSVEASACNQWSQFFFEYYAQYYDISGKTLIDVCYAADLRARQECTFYEYTKQDGSLVSLRYYVIIGDATIPE